MRYHLILFSMLFMAACGGFAAEEADTEEEGVVKADKLTVKHGEFWYAMREPKGKPQGYAHYVVKKRDAGGITVVWQLRIGFPGGSYEEDRTMVIDKDWKLVSATYEMAGPQGATVEGRRQGKKVKGKVTPVKTKEDKPFEADLPDDGYGGMDFVLAAFLPFKKGAIFRVSDVNEAQEFKNFGPAAMRVTGQEEMDWEGKKIKVWKVVRECVRQGQNVSLPMWINSDRQIVKTDWGGGNYMLLSSKPTLKLFRPGKVEKPEKPERPKRPSKQDPKEKRKKKKKKARKKD